VKQTTIRQKVVQLHPILGAEVRLTCGTCARACCALVEAVPSGDGTAGFECPRCGEQYLVQVRAGRVIA
jgi:predicted RNA-binding Zn-ribbon protein involved in translation (DUF1610 family)